MDRTKNSRDRSADALLMREVREKLATVTQIATRYNHWDCGKKKKMSLGYNSRRTNQGSGPVSQEGESTGLYNKHRLTKTGQKKTSQISKLKLSCVDFI